MNFFLDLILISLSKTWNTFQANFGFLAIAILAGVLLKAWFEPQKLTAWLNRHRGAGIIGATLFAVATPFCSCGTMAAVLGMLAGSMPWGPIVAFIVASPLTSPEGLFISAGLFGWKFALVFYAASIGLGLAGGAAAWWMEARGWLKDQVRFPATAGGDAAISGPPVSARFETAASPHAAAQPFPACACNSAVLEPIPAGGGCCAPGAVVAVQPRMAWKLPDFGRLGRDLWDSAARFIPMFLGFAFVGYFVNGLIPAEWMQIVFGQGNRFGVPLAAAAGLPFYLNSEVSLPLLRAMIEAGMSKGAALAFLITGAGTSIGAFSGLLTIARWRVVALVIAIYLVGAVALGIVYNLF